MLETAAAVVGLLVGLGALGALALGLIRYARKRLGPLPLKADFTLYPTYASLAGGLVGVRSELVPMLRTPRATQRLLPAQHAFYLAPAPLVLELSNTSELTSPRRLLIREIHLILTSYSASEPQGMTLLRVGTIQAGGRGCPPLQ